MVNSATTHDVIQMIRLASAAVTRAADHLNALDSAVGDGDHGTALSGAFAEAVRQIDAQPESSPAAVLKTAALALMNKMGGASGALYGTFYLRLSTNAGTKETLTHADWAAMFSAGLEGVTTRGKAEPGDKTLVDALSPAVNAFAEAANLTEAFAAAAEAAQHGAEATVAMTARHGRAKFAGERSVGHMDAGAASISVMFAAFNDYWMGVEHGEA